MAIMDLSRYAETVGTYTAEEAEKALEVKARPMEAGVHEVKVVELRKFKPFNAPEGTIEAICNLASDPNWLQFNLVLENASGQQSHQQVMMPLTNTLNYKGASGNEQTYTYRNFSAFIAALGFDPMNEEERAETSFMHAVVKSGGEALTALIGMQMKLKIEWDDKMVRPMYDSTNKSWHIANSEGSVMPDELAQPFALDKEKKGKDRWAEMATMAKEAGYMFQSSPYTNLLCHDTIKNDLSMFLPKKTVKAAAVITKPGAKPGLPPPKPTVATIGKPPLAKTPISSTITDAAALEDEAIPEE